MNSWFHPIRLMFRWWFQQAEKSIRFYQNIRGNNQQLVNMEINKLKSALNKTEKCDKTSIRWSDLLQNPARKAVIVCVFVTVLNVFSGIAALLCYTGVIFKESAGTDTSANAQAMSAIIVASIQFFGSFITTNFVDRAGRRVNMIRKWIIIQHVYSNRYLLFKF